jgi:hypothetical protein
MALSPILKKLGCWTLVLLASGVVLLAVLGYL